MVSGLLTELNVLSLKESFQRETADVEQNVLIGD
jgi:hypothetical protein